MNVLLLSRYTRLGASSRIRSCQYIPYLNMHGVEISIAPLFDDGYLNDLYAGRPKNYIKIIRSYLKRIAILLSAAQYDLLWVEYEIFPWLPSWFERMFIHTNTPCVVDYDDAIFHRYDMHQNQFVRLMLGRKIDNLMRRANLVTAGNKYLADRACRAGAKSVEILPSVIDLNRYTMEPVKDKPVFTIGWMGSPTTAEYLNDILPGLIELTEDGSTQIVLVGSGKMPFDCKNIEVRTWLEENEVGDICSFDVGIMPMPDNSWTQGKCGYKLIQYMACGRPVVASPVGVNRKLVQHGVNGFLAAGMDQWIKYIIQLKKDFHLRKRMGEQGRRIIEAEFCLQKTAPSLLDFFNKFEIRYKN